MSMLEDLDVYHRSKGIHALDFCCHCWRDCSKGQPRFTEAKSSFVGTKYESHHPHLLFLSLDSGSGETDKKKRTPQVVREEEESRRVECLPKNRHWYITHELAAKDLNSCRAASDQLEISAITPYFAHVNSAKCCQNNSGNGQGNQALYNNCRRYLSEELRILKPDIVITQGQRPTGHLRLPLTAS
jgi:hypothetical protein